MDAAAALERAYRDERTVVLATLARHLDGDLELAEDAVQDAFLAAADDWPRRGVPDRPGGWLTVTARRKAIDRLRHDRALARRLPVLEHLEQLMRPRDDDLDVEPDEQPSALADDRLRLIFTCCHPALELEARVALTLRSLGGLRIDEVARALLVSEPAMQQRLVRAKRKIFAARIPYAVPSDDQLPDRLAGVLRVVYLIFNEGYAPVAGDRAVRGELCDEALRLAGLLAELMPDEPEVLGLLALVLLTDARRPAREGEAYRSLEHQDRSRWDRARIDEGISALNGAARHGRAGPLQIQATIAAHHATARSFAETDWVRIVALYRVLEEIEGSPVVTVNRAVAVGHAEGPAAGLALLDALADDRRLARYQPLHAARAELLRRAGRLEEAHDAYGSAIELTANATQRAELERQRAKIVDLPAGPRRLGKPLI